MAFVVIVQTRAVGNVVTAHGPYRTREAANAACSAAHQSFDGRDYNALVVELTRRERGR